MQKSRSQALRRRAHQRYSRSHSLLLYSSHVHRPKKVGYGLIQCFRYRWAGLSALYLHIPLDTATLLIAHCPSLRSYIGYAREETLLERLHILLSRVKTHDFEVLSLEPHTKDGGVFVKFGYKVINPGGASEPEEILQKLRESIHSQGGVPSWIGLPTGEVWLVKGTPWREVRRLCFGLASQCDWAL